jgi:hypothetical protein
MPPPLTRPSRVPAAGLSTLVRVAAHLATKLAALVDRPDSAPGDKARHEIMARLGQNASTPDAVGVAHDASARKPAEATALIARAFEYLGDLRLDRNQREPSTSSPEIGTTVRSNSHTANNAARAGRTGRGPARPRPLTPPRSAPDHTHDGYRLRQRPTGAHGRDWLDDPMQASRQATTCSKSTCWPYRRVVARQKIMGGRLAVGSP